MNVRAKKYLGQNFLIDKGIIKSIISNIDFQHSDYFLEIGPGMGALTGLLLENTKQITLVELDPEAAEYISKEFISHKPDLILGDFLKLKLDEFKTNNLAIVGNFPYNISSQILFKLWDNHFFINQLVGMFQKEVAMRVASKHGNKNYGILSVLMQYDYEIKYLFDVSSDCFNPKPKVTSAVIQLIRKNNNKKINRNLFKKLVKDSFSQRRKKLRNVLTNYIFKDNNEINNFLNLRAEQLSVEDYLTLLNNISDE